MDHNQPTSFALLIVVGLEEGKSLCGVNVSWSDHLSLAAQRNKFGNTTKFSRTRSDFMSKSTTVTKLQALFRSGGVKQQLLF